MKISSFLMLIALVPNAFSQVESSGGTALVTTVTKNEITVAEDSRLERQGVYSDDDCKIITLHGKIIFGFSGLRGFRLTHGDIGWESHATANHAFEVSSEKTTVDAAKQFAILTKDAFGNAIKSVGLQRFLRKTQATPNNLAVGVFVGLNNVTKEPEEFNVRIFYSVPKKSVDMDFSETIAPEFPHFSYFATGSDPTLAKEFGDGTTFRANMEQRRWQETMIGKTTDETNSLFAVQLVKWEILYTKKLNIGGPVDYMVLTRAGITDHRKPSCQTTQ